MDENTEPTTIHHLDEITVEKLVALDLAADASAYDPDGIGTRDDIRAFRFFDSRDNVGNAVLFVAQQRLGVAFGSTSVWGDHRGDPDDLDAIGRAIVASADDEDWAR
jgi:hypothetical protein